MMSSWEKCRNEGILLHYMVDEWWRNKVVIFSMLKSPPVMIPNQTCLFIAYSKIMSFWVQRREILTIMRIITEKELWDHQLQARFLPLLSRSQNAYAGISWHDWMENYSTSQFEESHFFLWESPFFKSHFVTPFLIKKWFCHFMGVLLSFIQNI